MCVGNSNSIMGVEEARWAYYQTCVEQNLDHARHIENEQISFTSIFVAITCGVLAFALTQKPGLALWLGLCLIALEITIVLLITRWSKVFDRRIDAVKACEKRWLTELSDDQLKMSSYLPCGSLGGGVRTRTRIYVIYGLTFVVLIIFCLHYLELLGVIPSTMLHQ